MILLFIQVVFDNFYGELKCVGEQLMFEYLVEIGVKVFVYCFLNVFGKWCCLNYNSVIVIFCNNIVNDFFISVNDLSIVMNFVYIDDVVDEMIVVFNGNEYCNENFCEVLVIYICIFGEIVEIICLFKDMLVNFGVVDMGDGLVKKFYLIYFIYLLKECFVYFLKMNVDECGSFIEFIRIVDCGQVVVNIFKLGIIKGEYWYYIKVEKFVVVSGYGFIQMCKVDLDEVVNFEVFGDKIEVVEIILGYIYNIVNFLEIENFVILIWCNECFDLNCLDIYFDKVVKQQVMLVIDKELFDGVMVQVKVSFCLWMNYNLYDSFEVKVQRLMNVMEFGIDLLIYCYIYIVEMYFVLCGRINVLFYGEDGQLEESCEFDFLKGCYGVQIFIG